MVKKHYKQILMAVLVVLFIAPSCRRVPSTPVTVPSTPVKNQGMVLIKRGTFLMGTTDGMPYEGPVHPVTVKDFWVDEHEVTVAEFANFVTATGYQTDA